MAYRLGYVSEEIPGFERFVGWMCIPSLTRAGVSALKFRCLRHEDCKAEKCQRYDSPSGQVARLYNVEALHSKGDTIAIVEGELSALIVTELTGVPAVGTPGTNWMEHWSRCFADFENILVIADNDEKEDGSNPGLKHAKAVQKAVPGSRIITPPTGLDADEWILRDGAETVRSALS